MGCDYYCLLCLGENEPNLSRRELRVLRDRYRRLEESHGFPELGAIGHTTSDGLGCGMTQTAREGLTLLSAVVPARVLVLWLVFGDLTGVIYVRAQNGYILDEVDVVQCDTPQSGPFGCTMIAKYPRGLFFVRRNISSHLEPKYDTCDPGSGVDESD